MHDHEQGNIYRPAINSPSSRKLWGDYKGRKVGVVVHNLEPAKVGLSNTHYNILFRPAPCIENTLDIFQICQCFYL